MGFRKPREHWEKSKIIRKGKTLENGDILWMEDGRLYIEKKGN
jgi:ribosome-associated protein YbcJ (S4-like RNA binding protein)